MTRNPLTFIKILFTVFLATVFAVFALAVAFATTPTNVNVIMTQAGSTALTVSWSYPGSAPQGYWIMRNGGLLQLSTSATTVTWRDTSLSPGVTYVYKVAASTASGISPWSFKARGTTLTSSSDTASFAKPHDAFTNNSNMCQACHSIHTAATRFKVLYYRYSEQRSDYTGIQPGVDLCFNCHDGTGARNDIKSKYEDTASYEFAGHITRTTGGLNNITAGMGWKGDVTYAVGQQLPCMTCHDAHVSSLGNYKMLADELYQYAKTPNASNKWQSTGGWIVSSAVPWETSDDGRVTVQTSGSTYQVKSERCTVCHRGRQSDGAGGKTDGYMIVRGIDLYFMPKGDKGADCMGACHNDPHALKIAGYPTDPQSACDCHGDLTRVEDQTFVQMYDTSGYSNLSLHLITASPGSNPNSPNPGSCEFRCHNNHGQRAPTRAFNVWLDAQNRSAGSANYEYSSGYASGGLCLSCHGRSVQTTARAGGTSNSSAYVSRIYSQAGDGYPGYINTSHNYFTDGFQVGGQDESSFSFIGNCIKCHRSSNQNPGTNKGSKYGPHASANRSLLVYPTDEEGSGGGKYEELCFKCHDRDSSVTSTLRPNATGSFDAWATRVPAASAAWETVDEVAADDDSSYVQGAVDTIPLTQSFGIEDLSVAPGPIERVDIKSRLKESGGGAVASWYLVARSGTTTSIGTTFGTPGGSYVDRERLMYTSPFTGTAWTLNEINGLEIGVRDDDGQGGDNLILTQIYANIVFTIKKDYWTGRSLPTVAWKISQAFNEKPTWGHAWYLLSSSIDRHRAWGSEGTQPFWMTAGYRHVECVDCHNPHYVSQSYNYWASLPYTGSVNELESPNWRGASEKPISRPLRGVWGIYPSNWNLIPTNALGYTGNYNSPDPRGSDNIWGNADDVLIYTASAQKQAYICFKCHSSYAYGTRAAQRPVIPSGIQSAAYGGTPEDSLRIGPQTDVLAEFNPNNYGYHPVLSAGKNQPPNNANANWTGAYARNSLAYDTAGSPPGLTTAFVPPFGASSLITCSDCHSSSSSSYSRGYYTSAPSVVNEFDYPRGPHGSSRRWLLRTVDASIRYQRNNGTWFDYGGTAAELLAPTSIRNEGFRHFCLNCHRADVYGWAGFDIEASGDYALGSPLLSRQPHYPSPSGDGETNDTQVYGVNCRHCHGGRNVGGIHGSSAGKENSQPDVSGKRLLNGASWFGVDRGTTGAAGTCSPTAADTTVSSCGDGSVSRGMNDPANYDYDVGPD